MSVPRRLRRNRRAIGAFPSYYSQPPKTFDVTIPIAALNTLPTVAATLSAKGGGSIYVAGPGTYHATATIAMAANGAVANVDVYFSTGAQVVIDQGVEFPTTTGHTTGAIWTVLFEWANCSNCNIYNLYVTNNNTTSTHHNNIDAHHFGGNVQTLRFYDCYAKGFSRWFGHVTGYTSGVTGLGTQDGPIDDVIFVRPVGVNMGNTTTPDGGMLKIENQSGVATAQSRITNVGQIGVKATGLLFAGMDVSYTTVASQNNERVPAADGNFYTDGGSLQFATNGTKNNFGVWVEQGLTNSYQTAIQKVWARDLEVDLNGNSHAASTGVLDQGGADDTYFENITVLNGTASPGFQLTNSGNVPAHHTSGHTFRNCTAINCASIAIVDMTVGTSGSYMSDVLFDDVRGIDGGNGNMTTGLTLKQSATNPLIHAVFRKFDASRLAASSSSVALSFTQAVHPLNTVEFQSCPGISPMGALATPFGPSGAAMNVCGPQTGSAATNPTSGTTYTVMFRGGCTIAATVATLTALSVTDERGLPIMAFDEVNQARGAASAPTTGKTYTQTGQDMIWTFSQGSGSPTVTVAAFDGTPLYAGGTSSLTNAFIPAGSTIAVAGTVTGSTWTIKTVAGVTITNPFVENTTSWTAQFVPQGGSITATGTVGTWVVTAQTSPISAFSTITTPFGAIRPIALGIASGAAAPASTVFYRSLFGRLIDLVTGQATVTSIQVYDEYGGAQSLGADTSPTQVTIPAGWYFKEQATTIGTHTVSQVD